MGTTGLVNFVDHSSLEMYPQSIYNLPNESSTSMRTRHIPGQPSTGAEMEAVGLNVKGNLWFGCSTVAVVVRRECGPIRTGGGRRGVTAQRVTMWLCCDPFSSHGATETGIANPGPGHSPFAHSNSAYSQSYPAISPCCNCFSYWHPPALPD